MTATSLLALGCTADGGGDGRLAVVAAFYPLAEAATRVGGERVEVTDLTPPGTEPHDLELTTDDVDRIEDAALVLYLGGGFQPAVAEVAERAGDAAHDVLGGDAGATDDPHVWLDPRRMADIVEQVREALTAADGDGGSTYRANAEAYLGELAALDRDYAAGLADCARRTIVTSHAAFGHLARRYGLTEHAIAGVAPESEPDADRLAELADRVGDDGTTTIFTETLVPADVAETLAREAGVGTAVLHPIEGLTDEQAAAGETYVSLMRANLAALRAALECR